MPIESTYPVVWIEWVDSFSGRSGWEDIDDVVETFDAGCGNDIVSTGFLIHENDKWLTLSASVALGSATVTSQCDNPMTIPKCCIKKRYAKVLAYRPKPKGKPTKKRKLKNKKTKG